ncbi:MAG: Gfo/Idh/MocA family oxidoreductase [Hyphomicrobiales bacterium]|nr:Gfo/Idh/MocA family oxidoreductase [Hyphomicrobiales bacterium]
MKTDPHPLKFAVIGVGSMGRNHARILASSPTVDLVGIVDPDPDARRQIASMAQAEAMADVEEAIARGIDAAIVAVPTVQHHDVARRLIDAGVHVLIEKPIAATSAEAHDLIDRAAAKGTILTVGHVERFNPAIRTLYEAIGGEDIISIAISRVGPFPPRISDVGIVTDLGVHDIDLIRWLSGSEIVEHQSLLTRARGQHEDIAFLQFRLANGALAHINTNWLTPFKERRISVSTAKRFIVCDMLLRTVNEFSGFMPDGLPDRLAQGSFVSRSLSVPFVEPLRAEIDAFIDAIRGRGPVMVSGLDGARTLEVALACLA